MQTKTKMGFFFSLFLLFCFGIMNPAYARNLVKVDESSDGEVTKYVDRDGIRRVGRFVWFWDETVTRDFSGRVIYHSRGYNSADCGNNSYSIRELLVLVDQGETVNSYNNFGDSEPVQLAVPGSLMESAIEYACRNF